jgi:hypothetical protein
MPAMRWVRRIVVGAGCATLVIVMLDLWALSLARAPSAMGRANAITVARHHQDWQ